MTSLQLDRSFLMGPATSAYQVEGGLDGPQVDYSVYASVLPSQGGEYKEGPAGDACKHYLLYEDDIAMTAELGFGSYRFEVAWPRIQPEKGKFDAVEIDHYRRVLQACRNHGLRPVVTLQHFITPAWVIREGGWEWPQLPKHFGDFAARVTDVFGDLILGSGDDDAGAIVTINELNTGVVSATRHGSVEDRRKMAWAQHSAAKIGVDPSMFTPWRLASSDLAVQVIIEAHRHAVQAIKQVDPRLTVGMSVASQNAIPLEPDDDAAVRWADAYMRNTQGRFLSEVRASKSDGGDFVGVQAYVRNYIGRRTDGTIGMLPPADGAPLSTLGYEICPDALEMSLRRTHRETELPVIATECGVAVTDGKGDDDARRIAYYDACLRGVARCVADDVPVRGFFAWSLLDNYEWLSGYGPRFGVVGVDRVTQAREPKPSARYLGEIARRLELPDPSHERNTPTPGDLGRGLEQG